MQQQVRGLVGERGELDRRGLSECAGDAVAVGVAEEAGQRVLYSRSPFRPAFSGSRNVPAILVASLCDASDRLCEGRAGKSANSGAEFRYAHSTMTSRKPLDPKVIDALYALEPVFEPGADAAVGLAEFVAVQCPYCGETFETAVDLSAGSFHYVEDCQVCCQPIELAGEVDDGGRLAGFTAGRSG